MEGASSRDRRVFPIRYSRWLGWLFWLMGLGAGRVDLDGDRLRVRMGWGFQASIPRASIRRAARSRDVWWAVGVHSDFRGRWLVNGSSHDIVALELDPPARARTMLIPVNVRKLGIGLTDPDRFLKALEAPA